MSWMLVAQIAALAVVGQLLVVGGIAHIIDKRREDAHKRKDGGL